MSAPKAPKFPSPRPRRRRALASVVVPSPSRRTNTSAKPFASPGHEVRRGAREDHGAPAGAIAGVRASVPGGAAGPSAREASVVVAALMSRTKTSTPPSVSAGVRFVAPEAKTMRLPSALIAGVGGVVVPSPPFGPSARETTRDSPVSRSRRTTAGESPSVPLISRRGRREHDVAAVGAERAPPRRVRGAGRRRAWRDDRARAGRPRDELGAPGRLRRIDVREAACVGLGGSAPAAEEDGRRRATRRTRAAGR